MKKLQQTKKSEKKLKKIPYRLTKIIRYQLMGLFLFQLVVEHLLENSRCLFEKKKSLATNIEKTKK